jgi:hypothetical protein
MMRKIFVLILIILISGCVLPNDTDFLKMVKDLDMPYKICTYMEDNFTYNCVIFQAPYELWQSKIGACTDFASFGVFVANYHGYESYVLGLELINNEGNFDGHAIAVYNENGKYTFSDNWLYFPVKTDNIQGIVEFYNLNNPIWKITKYHILDYELNVIEGNIDG